MNPYFSHDVFARENLKIKRLINKHKMTGYGVFWAIVEFLHNNQNRLCVDELSIIAFEIGVDIEVVESVVKDFKLFSIRKNVVSSKRVAKNLKLQKEKSKLAKVSATHRWKEFSANANALRTHSERNAIKEIKEKEINKIKENESKESKESEECKLNEENGAVGQDSDNAASTMNQAGSSNVSPATDISLVSSSDAVVLTMNQAGSSNVSQPADVSLTGAVNLPEGTASVDSSSCEGKFYSSNVYLTSAQYGSLAAQYGQSLTDTIISELSYKISTGKEQAFNADMPQAHFYRLLRYARQKLLTTQNEQSKLPYSTTGQYSQTTGSNSQAGAGRQQQTSGSQHFQPDDSQPGLNGAKSQCASRPPAEKPECEALRHIREIKEQGGVPPPPEFFEAGERLRRAVNARKMPAAPKWMLDKMKENEKK